MGKKKALVAIGHKLLVAIYHVLKNREAYKELGADYLTKRTMAQQLAYHKNRLEQLGYTVEIKEAA